GEGALERGTFADDFLEIKFAADFFFKIKFFFGKFVFQGLDFLEGESVFNGDGDLGGDRLEELDVFWSERIDLAAREIERAESMAVMNQRHATDGLQTFGAENVDDFRVKTIEFGTARDQGLAGSDGAACGRN